MSVEGFGNKIFYYTALAKLKTLQVYPLYGDVDELHLIDMLRTDSNLWAPVEVHREHIFNDAGLVAKYELDMLDAFQNPSKYISDWQWSGFPKSLGMAFFNIPLWKQSETFLVKAAIMRTGQNEWRTYKYEPINP
jgi:hypothetical protein